MPVLFSDASPEQIPTPIKGWTRYVVDTEDGYEELYRRLTGQPRLLRPALGTIRPLPTRRRQWPEGTMAGGFVIACCQAALHSGSCCWGEEGNAREDTLALPSAGERSAGFRAGSAAALVVLAGGVWAVVTFFSSPHPPPPAPETNVEAPGGVAAGRDIRGSTITVHPQAPPAASPSNPDPGAGR